MLFAYFYIKNNYLIKYKELKINDSLPKNTIWIDLIQPNKNEEKYIEKILTIETPTEKEMEKFEVISPFYVTNNVGYMTVTVHDKNSKNYPDSIAITFILTDKYLITTRFDNPKSFDYLHTWIIRKKNQKILSNDFILINIIDFIINCCSDILQESGNEIDKLLTIVFKETVDKKKIT